MPNGMVEAIFIGAVRKQPMSQVQEVKAIAGEGLEGDRYCRPGHPESQITLTEAEALEASVRDYEIEIGKNETRRNLLTRGVALNHLVGREFRVGDVRLRGLELCEPCGHLKALTNKDVIKALRHRGGLRAEILESGVIKVGDAISD